jgi:hypothetical protein
MEVLQAPRVFLAHRVDRRGAPLMDAPRDYRAATAFALNDMADELDCARRKFPVCEHSYAALLEELGELAAALFDHKCGLIPPRDVRAEALQVACVAVRIGTEGDLSYSLAPSADIAQATERLTGLVCGRLDNLRRFWPSNLYALVKLTHAVNRIGVYLAQEQRNWQVCALESSAVHVVAWALRIAIEGDAAFPYAAPTEYGA